MSKHGTKIEWTHIPGYSGESWNPITGCSPVSEGCENCYAERISKRFGWPWGETVLHSDRLDQPTRWTKPRAIFVCSMGDLFHEDLADSDIHDVMNVIVDNPRHLFLVLTKRAARMQEYLSGWNSFSHGEYPPRNIWYGVTAENQRTADERIPILLQTPATKRFVSVEPMLERIDIGRTYEGVGGLPCPAGTKHWATPIDWVICGGESGPKARPMKWEWPIHLLGQCEAAGVPFFMKQMSQNGGADRHDIPAILQAKEFPS